MATAEENSETAIMQKVMMLTEKLNRAKKKLKKIDTHKKKLKPVDVAEEDSISCRQRSTDKTCGPTPETCIGVPLTNDSRVDNISQKLQDCSVTLTPKDAARCPQATLDCETLEEVFDNTWEKISVLNSGDTDPVLYIHAYRTDGERVDVKVVAVVTTALTVWFSEDSGRSWHRYDVNLPTIQTDMTDRIVPLQSLTTYGIALVGTVDGEISIFTYTVQHGSGSVRENLIYKCDMRGDANLYAMSDNDLLLSVNNCSRCVPVNICMCDDFSRERSIRELEPVNTVIRSFFPLCGLPKVVAGLADNTLHIWERTLRRVVKRVPVGEGIANSVTLAKEEQGLIFLVTSGGNTENIATVVVVNPSNNNWDICYSMDPVPSSSSVVRKRCQQGKFLAVMTELGDIFIWDAYTACLVSAFRPSDPYGCGFHLNDSHDTLVVGHNDGHVSVYFKIRARSI